MQGVYASCGGVYASCSGVYASCRGLCIMYNNLPSQMSYNGRVLSTAPCDPTWTGIKRPISEATQSPSPCIEEARTCFRSVVHGAHARSTLQVESVHHVVGSVHHVGVCASCSGWAYASCRGSMHHVVGSMQHVVGSLLHHGGPCIMWCGLCIMRESTMRDRCPRLTQPLSMPPMCKSAISNPANGR